MASGGDTTAYTLHPYDVSRLHVPCHVLFIASPGGGKTSTLRSVLLELYFDAARAARTDFPPLHIALYGSKADGEYKNLVHPVVTHDDISSTCLKNIVNRLLRMRHSIDDGEVATATATAAAGGGATGMMMNDGVDVGAGDVADIVDTGVPTGRADLQTRVIIDDCSNSRSIFENVFARFMYRRGRHVGLSVFLALQYVNDVSLWVKQLTQVVFLRNISNSERQTAFRNFGHHFKSFSEFNDILSKVTEVPNRSLVIDTRVLGAKRPRSQAEPFPPGGPVAYYDHLPHDVMDRVINELLPHKMLHPDILSFLEERGDPSKYNFMQLME